MRAQKLCLIYLSMHTYTSFKMWLTSVTHDAMHVLPFLQFIVPCVYATYVEGSTFMVYKLHVSLWITWIIIMGSYGPLVVVVN